MKSDPDLMRSILLDAEEIPAGEAVIEAVLVKLATG